MGGTFYTVKIERTSADAISPLALHTHIWERISMAMYNRLKKAGNRVTTADYLGSEAYDGLRGGEGGDWTQTETELYFSFGDAAGCCGMSYGAAAHWTEIVFVAGWQRLAVPGWKLLAPELPIETEVIFGPRWPLAYLKTGMFAMVPRERGKPLVVEGTEAGFGDSNRLEWSELAGADREIAEFVALTGLCQCDLCMRFRPARERYKPREHVAAARAAWDLLDGGEHAALEAEAAAAAFAWDWTAFEKRARLLPPPLSVLLDWLASHDAPIPATALASMLRVRARR